MNQPPNIGAVTAFFGVTLLGLSLGATHVAAETDEARLRAQLPCQLSFTTPDTAPSTWWLARVPPSITAHAQADRNDLRLFDAAGNAIPYAVVKRRAWLDETRADREPYGLLFKTEPGLRHTLRYCGVGVKYPEVHPDFDPMNAERQSVAKIVKIAQRFDLPDHDSQASVAMPTPLRELSLGAALDPAQWAWSAPLNWPTPVTTPMVHVLLPGSAYGRSAFAELDDLRVVVKREDGPFQLPFMLDKTELAVLATHLPSTPSPRKDGWSIIPLAIEHPKRPDIAVRLSTDDCPFERVVYLKTEDGKSLGRKRWSCMGSSGPKPLLFSGIYLRSGALEIHVEDGDNAPLDPIKIEVLGRSHLLRMPAVEGSPRIVVGHRLSKNPSYDLKFIAERCRTLPHTTVGLQPWKRQRKDERSAVLEKWTLPLIGLAALVLALLLVWTLRRSEEPEAKQEGSTPSDQARPSTPPSA